MYQISCVAWAKKTALPAKWDWCVCLCVFAGCAVCAVGFTLLIPLSLVFVLGEKNKISSYVSNFFFFRIISGICLFFLD
jgi:hypothetical protein